MEETLYNQNDWIQLKEEFPIDSIIQGKVHKIMPYGIFLAINRDPFLAFVNVPEIVSDPINGPNYLDNWPKEGQIVNAVVLAHRDYNCQIVVSLKRMKAQ